MLLFLFWRWVWSRRLRRRQEVNDRPTGDVEIATDDMISRRHFPARLLELSAACSHRPCVLFRGFVLAHGHFIALSTTTGRQKQVSVQRQMTRLRHVGFVSAGDRKMGRTIMDPLRPSRWLAAARLPQEYRDRSLRQRCADLESLFCFQSAVLWRSLQTRVLSQYFMVKNLPRQSTSATYRARDARILAHFCASQFTKIFNGVVKAMCTQERNHGWKVEGTKIWVPTPGRLRPAPGQRPDWVLGAGGGYPLPLWGFGVSTPENFWKLRC